MNRLAIVGCRLWNDYDTFHFYVEKWISQNWKPDVIISGGGRGTDKMAEKYANLNHIPIEIYPAEWNLYGKSAGPIRNNIIADRCSACLAFPSISSVGTLDTIAKVVKLEKPVHIVKM